MYEVAYDIREILRDLRDDIRAVDERVDQIEYWRWRIAGGFGVAGLLIGLATGLAIYLVTGQ